MNITHSSCSFCSFYSKIPNSTPSKQTLSLLSSAIISLFFKFVYSPTHWKYVIVPVVFCNTWNSPSGTFFANKRDYVINKE